MRVKNAVDKRVFIFIACFFFVVSFIPSSFASTLRCQTQEINSIHASYNNKNLKGSNGKIYNIKTINLEDGDVSYSVIGKGAPILYFHGINTSIKPSLLDISCYLERGHKVILPARPGYPVSSYEGKETPKECAHIAGRILKKLTVKGRVIVVGRSAGGPCALAFVNLFPNRVAGLILESAISNYWARKKFVPLELQEAFCRSWRCSESDSWTITNYIRLMGEFGKKLQASKESEIKSSDLFQQAFVGKERLRTLSASDKSLLKSYTNALLDLINHDTRTAPEAFKKKSIFSDTTYLQGVGIDGRYFLGVNRLGELENIRNIPILIIHDPLDPIVPIAHAYHVKEQLSEKSFVKLLEVNTAGHFTTFGKDATKAQRERRKFLDLNRR